MRDLEHEDRWGNYEMRKTGEVDPKTSQPIKGAVLVSEIDPTSWNNYGKKKPWKKDVGSVIL